MEIIGNVKRKLKVIIKQIDEDEEDEEENPLLPGNDVGGSDDGGSGGGGGGGRSRVIANITNQTNISARDGSESIDNQIQNKTEDEIAQKVEKGNLKKVLNFIKINKTKSILFGISGIVILLMIIWVIILIFKRHRKKTKKQKKDKKEIKKPEEKSFFSFFERNKNKNKKINDLLLQGENYLISNDKINARKNYEKIKKIYNFKYDKNRKIYKKIIKFYDKMVKNAK